MSYSFFGYLYANGFTADLGFKISCRLNQHCVETRRRVDLYTMAW